MAMKDQALERIRLWEPGKPLNLSNLSLTRLPNIPRGVEILDCSHNSIRKIHSLPKSIKILYCDFNELTYISNLPKNIEHINCGFNKLEYIDITEHKKVRFLNIQNNRFRELPTLPDNILVLKASFNPMKRIGKLPANLHTLNLYNCMLEKIDSLPDNLKMFYCENNSLKDLPKLPPRLVHLNCSNNFIRYLPPLSQSMKILLCCSNKMNNLPPIPEGLESLFCSYNSLLFLPNLPESLRRIDFRHNPVAVPPTIPMNVAYLNGLDLYQEEEEESLPNLPKEYTILREVDAKEGEIKDVAFDTIKLEDVDVREYLDTCPFNIVLKSCGQLYAYSRRDLRQWFDIHTNRFVCGDNVYFRLPWNQIIDYHNACKFTFLDYSIFDIVKTEDKIVRNNDLTNVYSIHSYSLKSYINRFTSKSE